LVVELCLHELDAVEYRIAEVRAGEIREGEIRPGDIGFLEVAAPEVGIAKIAFRQGGPLKRNIGGLGGSQIGAAHVRPRETRSLQLRIAEERLCQVRSVEHTVLQILMFEVDSRKLSSRKILLPKFAEFASHLLGTPVPLRDACGARGQFRDHRLTKA